MMTTKALKKIDKYRKTIKRMESEVRRARAKVKMMEMFYKAWKEKDKTVV